MTKNVDTRARSEEVRYTVHVNITLAPRFRKKRAFFHQKAFAEKPVSKFTVRLNSHWSDAVLAVGKDFHHHRRPSRFTALTNFNLLARATGFSIYDRNRTY